MLGGRQMTLQLVSARARSTNQIELSFSGPVQLLPQGALDPLLFTVMADGGSRRISTVVREGEQTVVLSIPGRALATFNELILTYESPDLTMGRGYLGDINGDPLASILGRTVSTLVTASSLSKPMGKAYLELILLGDKPINGIGNALANTITGNGSANFLDGRGGADRLIGGAGNDRYQVDETADTVIEALDEGIDLILASVSYNLPDHVENLTLIGWEGWYATGNGLNNTLIGNNGPNVLDGGPGADVMRGGKGHDTYVVDLSTDQIVETGLETDHDTVLSSISWTLGAKLEELRLQGELPINAFGNERHNTLIGNNAANVLDGGRAGTDVLTGMAGADVFRFSFLPPRFSEFHADHITDFNSAEGDVIQLSRASFKITSNTSTLVTVEGNDATEVALGTGVMFVYDRLKGALHWNQNGVTRGAGSGGIFAILDTKPALTAANIVLS